MAENENDTLKPFLNRVHRVGRVGSFITICAFIGAGVLVCAYFNYVPNMGSLLIAVVPLMLMMLFGSSLSEFLAYLPRLGPGATYISYITGNVTNMKLPSVLGTMKALDVKENTEEFHILSIISACTASLLVILLLGVVVLFSGFLTPILSAPVIQPAIDYIMPALYPVMVTGLIRANPLMCLIVLIVAVPAYLLFGMYGGMIGGMLTAIIYSIIRYEMKQNKAKEA